MRMMMMMVCMTQIHHPGNQKEEAQYHPVSPSHPSFWCHIRYLETLRMETSSAQYYILLQFITFSKYFCFFKIFSLPIATIMHCCSAVHNWMSVLGCLTMAWQCWLQIITVTDRRCHFTPELLKISPLCFCPTLTYAISVTASAFSCLVKFIF